MAWSILRFVLLSLVLPSAVSASSRIDDEPELAVEQVRQEAALEVKFAGLKRKYGIRDRRTLETFFELFELWIMLYRLNKADAALLEVVPACEWRRDDFAIKAVQALAFTRWKQGRFREALSRFHEMEGFVGKNAALSENIGHTYNALHKYDQAERYFREALTMTHASNTEGNEGGILLGIAGVQERRGDFVGALPTAVGAYDFYRSRDVQRGWDTSLTAKAAMQLSKIHWKLGAMEVAEKFTREAVLLFEKTAGDDSPLVAGAMERLAYILWERGRREEAQEAYHRAYKLEAIKDALDLVTILEIHNKLVEVHISGSSGLDRDAFSAYFGVVDDMVGRVRREYPQDGNAGAYYKAAGELHALGGDCRRGRPLLDEARQLFVEETSIDTSGLVKQCEDLIAYCDGTLSARKGNDAALAQ